MSRTDTRMIQTHAPVYGRVARIALALLCVFALVGTSACSERKSTKSKSSESSSEGGAGAGEQTQTPSADNKKRSPNSAAKAQRVVNQMNNYMLAIASSQGAPEDLEAAKTALKDAHQLNWVPDPWGNLYVYKKTGVSSFELFSAGPDGAEGTDDDIRPQN